MYVTCRWCCYHGYRRKTYQYSPHFSQFPERPPLERWHSSQSLSCDGTGSPRGHLGPLHDRCCGICGPQHERSLRRTPPAQVPVTTSALVFDAIMLIGDQPLSQWRLLLYCMANSNVRFVLETQLTVSGKFNFWINKLDLLKEKKWATRSASAQLLS